ncbi:hypothetical protein AVEN_116375-1 [Araneus ventricosus]|uniref:Uncharacterized protein n=1 Tax=Araneus ventricosus TaxID=182803 RepID=A0A4Y2WW30_ARAVE|nr:hypothetical protein AVEN_116375-1 [Araneus ventricosus]
MLSVLYLSLTDALDLNSDIAVMAGSCSVELQAVPLSSLAGHQRADRCLKKIRTVSETYRNELSIRNIDRVSNYINFNKLFINTRFLIVKVLWFCLFLLFLFYVKMRLKWWSLFLVEKRNQ